VKSITFGQFRLDLTNECLWQGTRAISLRPKAFGVLKILLAHPGELVNKQQVLDAVWPGTFVGDAVLKDSIRQLREALGDKAGSPSYIETAHRRGYRFIGKLAQPAMGKKSSPPAGGFASQLAPGVDAPGSAVPILGREAELAKMRGWLDRVLAGERQTVFVTGEAGIGKTTVVQAFLEQAGQVSEALVVRGQCLEHFGSGEAYLPVLDGFSRLCRSSAGAQVLEVLREQAPSWLAHMSSLAASFDKDSLQSQAGGATRERMMREMAEAIDQITEKRPLLLVLEDLHWSDYSTLDLISHLARRRDSARLMVIGTYRPVDVILSGHPLRSVKQELQAHRLCQELPLEYLTEEAVAQYLKARFDCHQLPRRLRREIYRRTEGNPLFMVSLVEYLIHQNVIVEEHGTWKLSVDLAELEHGVPSSVKELIQKQIERLSADERAVLEAASATGMEFSTVAIAAGLDVPTARVEMLCDELARRHQFLSTAWLAELPDGTVTSRHRFNHVLYREVPYSLMSPMRRAQIHQRIAERAVEIYCERASEIAAELAMHFEQSRDWPRALKYLLQAAENAAASSAHYEVTDLATRGLNVLKSLPDTSTRAQQEIKLRMVLGVSLIAIKGFASAEVEEVFARGRELFWLQGPSPELFQMLWALGLYHQFSGNVESSLQIAKQLLELAEDLKQGTLIMEAHRAVGAALVILGRFSEALQHLDEATALYAIHSKYRQSIFLGQDCKVICDCFAARALWVLGQPDQAAQRMDKALAFARGLGHPQTLVVAGYSAAQLHQLRGEASLVYERANEAMELADEYGLEFWLSYGVMELGWADAELGKAQEGIEQMQRGLAAYMATGAKLWCPYFLGLLAGQLAKVGRVEEGLTAISKALTLAEETGESYSTAELYRIKGDLILQSDDVTRMNSVTGNQSPKRNEALSIPDNAESCFDQAILIAKQQQTKSWELRAQLSRDRSVTRSKH
jgi:DNA-binding winged helix-turn-helix (wHTH) protein/predicted ATPase